MRSDEGRPQRVPPVLLLIFNRPDSTRQVAERIAESDPPRIYIAADGPRGGRDQDKVLCEEARSAAQGAGWRGEVATLYREENLGCERAVSGAIDWFFAQETEGVILEDDCLPDPSFFPYAGELLKRYRDDGRIVAISGNGAHSMGIARDTSYVFSRYNHIWGWATWRDRWAFYDAEMSEWPHLRDTEWLLEISDGDRHFARYWRRAFDQAYYRQVDTWGYRWTYACWRREGLTTLPSRNIVKNIGFGPNATHTTSADQWLNEVPLEDLAFPLVHPAEIDRDSEVDEWTDSIVFRTRPTMRSRLKQKARQLLDQVAKIGAARRGAS